MQGFISRFLEPSHNLLVRIPAMSRAHTRMMDDNNARQSNAVPQVAEEAPKKSSARERLDALSDFRISASAITFTSEKSGGSGGKGDVVRASFKRRKWGRKQVVAVKKLRCGDAMQQPKVSREFAHEVGVMAGLAHGNIVRFIGFVEDLGNGKAWIVLSWEPNGNVSEFLATGNWEIPERVSLIQDTFEGVKYLHTRQPPICHGDLKSFNILVSSSYRAIITDFGSARAITESEDGALNQELDRQAQGSPTTEQAHPQIHVAAVGNQLTLTGPAWSLRWAPPEVVDGKRPSLSTDIWAGGWICWEVMTDKVPFHEVNSAGAITLMVVRGEVPAARDDAKLAQIIALCSLMKDCWSFDPKARPTITQCCNELEWIPSIPPSGGKVSDHGVPSIELLFEMAKMHYRQNDLERATSLSLEALSLARSAGDQTQALNFLGRIYLGQSEYTRAEESFTRAQEICARASTDLGRATALVGLGDLYRIQSKYSLAEEVFTRAQEIYTRSGDDLGRAKALDGVGQVYRCQSKYTQAEESYTQAQEICARVGNEQLRANTLENLGQLYLLQSEYARAEEWYTRAQEIYTRLGDDHGQANTFFGIGNIYQLQSKYTQAEELFTRALEIYTRGGSDHGRANTLDGLGRIYCHQSKYTQAEEPFTQAQEIYGRVGDDLGQAGSLFGLGQAYYLQSKYTEAEGSYTQAQEIFTRMGDDQGRANVLYDLGHLRQNQGRNMEAASHYAEAKDLYAQIGGTEDEENAARCLAAVSPKQDSSTA